MSPALPDDRQRDFAVALLAPALPPPAGLRTHNGSDADARFGVYRNNVISSLAAVLLWLMTRGAGVVSLDHLLFKRKG